MLRLIAEPEKWTGPRCEAARILFQNLDYTAKLSQWWERLVDLTIVSLSYNNKPFCEVFNINSNNMSKVPHLKVIREAAAVKTAGWDDDALVVPDSESQRGFDSRLSLLLDSNRNGVFVHVKVDNPLEFERAYANSIIYSIADGVSRGLSLNRIYIIVYNWGLVSCLEKPSIDSVREKVADSVRNPNIQLSEEQKEIILEFINDHDLMRKNFHIVSRDEMKPWLLPSLLSIPSAILNIQD